MDRLITCGDAVERLWAFLDHELDHHDHKAVEAHLAYCLRCCGELEFAKHLRQLLGTTDGGRIPPGTRARLDRLIDGFADTPTGGDST